ncbi:MAG: Ig-like domain-containing protein [bacterium]
MFCGVVFFTALFIFSGCAKQGYPPGGPVDRTGPYVEDFYPALEATQVAVKVRPWIVLNEYPAVNSLAGAVFVSPQMDEGFEVRSRGKRIEVRFRQELPVDRTIVVTFGSGIKDRNGNPMNGSHVLAFSTGERMDKASLKGKLEGISQAGAAWIWAYPLSEFSEPDPRRDKAPFAVQPDLAGDFALDFLPEGEYRIFGVEETRRNRLWDGEQEAMALPSADLNAQIENPPFLSLRLVNYDLKPPSLRSALSLHRQGLRLVFDEAVVIGDAVINATAQDGSTLPIIDLYQNPGDSSALLCTTAPQRVDDQYTIRLDRLRDRSDNWVDSIVVEAPAATLADTVGPRLSWTYPGSAAQNINPNAAIQLGFTEAVILTDLPRAVQLQDSTGTALTGEWSFLGSALGMFTPQPPPIGGASYTLQVSGDSLRDIFGNTCPDSLVSISFSILDLQETGSITGSVKGAVANLNAVAEARTIPDVISIVPVAENGEFEFQHLPAADYRIWLYEDRNYDGIYSVGVIDPFYYAEPFQVAADSIRVRVRWTTEQVNLFWTK